MKTLLRFALSAVVLLIPTLSSGKTVEFLYDASGNRITRQIVIQTRSLPMEEDNGESKPDEMFQDQVAEKTIRIYPNPTKGDLKVEISGYEERDSGTLMLFSMSGQLLMTADITAEINDLNLSNLPDGMYILRISLNGDDSVWRIIKD